MRLAKRENNEIIVEEKIKDIKGLENHQLVLLERGDELKKSLKKARNAFGNKSLYSVKSIKEALEEVATKEAKKQNPKGTWCCCCAENWTTDKSGYCPECKI